MTQPMTSRSSASIRALVQEQAQRRQAERQSKDVSGGRDDSFVGDRSEPSSPYPADSITPILVTPESPDDLNDASQLNGVDSEQEEALDFSRTEKDSNNAANSDADTMRQVADVSRHSYKSNPDSMAIKEENKEKSFMTSSMHGDPHKDSVLSKYDVSSESFLKSSLASVNHSAFPSPFPTYAFVNGISPMSALNMTMASRFSLPASAAAASTGGISIQYTPNGPIAVGADGQNLSQPPAPHRVKDMLMYKQQQQLQQPAAALKKQKPGKQLREGDFVLDQMGEDLRKRRRRSPNETLTAEEIAEYMGASNVPSGRDGGVMFKCKYCNEELENLVGYLQHTLTIHNAYICHQCGKSFTTKSSLLRHRPIHTGLRRFACSICKKSFYRKDKCKSHIKRHLPASEQNVDQYQRIEPVPEMTQPGVERYQQSEPLPLTRPPPPPAQPPRSDTGPPLGPAAAAAAALQLSQAAVPLLSQAVPPPPLSQSSSQLSHAMSPFKPTPLLTHSLPEISGPMIM